MIGIEGVPLAVEEMYRNGGVEFSRTFCADIDGFIYKVSSNLLTNLKVKSASQEIECFVFYRQ